MGTFRFLLALAVVLNHFEGVWGYYMMLGSMAVQSFFMISGFLIALVLSQKYDPGTADGRRLFFSNRLLRIFVPYWSVCLTIVLAHLLIFAVLGVRYGFDAALVNYGPEMTLMTRIYLLLSNIFILTQEWAMWLTYENGAIFAVLDSDQSSPHVSAFQLVPQAWSISLELMFYALAPFLVRRHWATLLAIIVVSYALRSLCYSYGFRGSGFAYRFFPFEIGLFVAGVLSYRVYAWIKRHDLVRSPILSVAVAAAFIITAASLQYLHGLGSRTFQIMTLIALPALFEIAQRSSLDRWLGELSYPIYLVHIAAIQTAGLLFESVRASNWFKLATIAAVVLLCVGYVHWIDAPFERWRQRRTTRTTRARTGTLMAGPKEPSVAL